MGEHRRKIAIKGKGAKADRELRRTTLKRKKKGLLKEDPPDRWSGFWRQNMRREKL